MPIKLCAAALALLGALLGDAQGAELTQVSLEKSQIAFVSKQMGVAVDGVFKRFDAQVAVDPARPEAGHARIDVDLGSIDTGSTEADGEVKGKGWFNIAAFPRATFVSGQVRKLGDNRYEALGKLTIKGISRDVATLFTLRPEGNGTWVDGSFGLQRLQFKVGEGEWADTSTVADEVRVKFRLYLTPGGQK